jgi:hypothetical protein
MNHRHSPRHERGKTACWRPGNPASPFPVLGIDIGRVIIAPADVSGGADTSFLGGSDSDALATPPAEHAFEAIRSLVEAFDGNVWLVSKCGPRVQQRTREWLRHQRFHELTGVRPDRVRFCRQRREKREHCAAIGATHFIDDRLDVLRHLVDFVPHLYWFGHQARAVDTPSWAERTLTWYEAEIALKAALARVPASVRTAAVRDP